MRHSVAMTTLKVEPHPLLRAYAFTTALPRALAEMPTPPGVLDFLAADAPAPLSRDEAVRAAVRDMLRVRGYKPTGRGKPASEYLVKAAQEGGLRSINLVVDACNAVSLHSALPISVIDTDVAIPPFSISVPGPGSSYVFNASGQEIDITGLPCVYDAAGPCANAVKDSQRTKTRDETRHTLSVIWGEAQHEDVLARAAEWYRSLLHECGANTDDVRLES